MLFLKHNIWNEFDDLTDVARFYKAKAVPGFIFLTGGAMVSQSACTSIRDMLDARVSFKLQPAAILLCILVATGAATPSLPET